MTQTVIRAEKLCKNYGDVRALADASFEVSRGDILGLLGPNGAGKSTLIRILTGYIPATSGRAEIAGFDVFRHGMEVRSRIGYLPESTPLYHDMRVAEYLRFRARLKRVPRRLIKQRVAEAGTRCHLGSVSNQIIGNLSKGYRQRVGLADALVNDPEILILDEPTVGLDPVQVRQMRTLLADLARERTILFSSHILTEVEAVCRRVLIIRRGEIVAHEDVEQFRRDNRLRIHLAAEVPGLRERLAVIAGVTSVSDRSAAEQAVVYVTYDLAADPRGEIFRQLVALGATVHEMRSERLSLEDRFIEAIS